MNYQSISSYQEKDIDHSRVVNDSESFPEHGFSYKRHIRGGVLAFGLLMLGYLGRYGNIQRTEEVNSLVWKSVSVL